MYKENANNGVDLVSHYLFKPMIPFSVHAMENQQISPLTVHGQASDIWNESLNSH